MSWTNFAIDDRACQRRSNDDSAIDLVCHGLFQLPDFSCTLSKQRQTIAHDGNGRFGAAKVFSRSREFRFGGLQLFRCQRLKGIQVSRSLRRFIGDVEGDPRFVHAGTCLGEIVNRRDQIR